MVLYCVVGCSRDKGETKTSVSLAFPLLLHVNAGMLTPQKERFHYDSVPEQHFDKLTANGNSS